MITDRKGKCIIIEGIIILFSKGGAGGRVINIASMAGLVPGVTGFEGLGYPVSKWGTVAFTRYKNADVSQKGLMFLRVLHCFNSIYTFRSYSKCARPKPWEDVKIKAYALCPWFADTQLFNDSKGVNETEKESRESLSNRFRILTVEDVGDAFEQAIDADDNGGVFMVFPDSPIIKFPELNQLFIFPVLIYAKLFSLCFSQWKLVNGMYALPLSILIVLATFYMFVCFLF